MKVERNILNLMRETQLPAAPHTAMLLPSSLIGGFEMVLGRAVDCHKAGEDLVMLQCNGRVAGCVANPFGFARICAHCRRVRDTALDHHLKDVPRISVDDYVGDTPGKLYGKDVQKNIQEDIENGAKSTILTHFRVNVCQPNRWNWAKRWGHRLVYAQYIRHSRFIFEGLSRLFEKLPVSRIEFYNGRLVPGRAVVAVAQSAGVSYALMDTWGIDKSLIISNNNSLHDLEFHKGILREFMQQPMHFERHGHDFFHLRRKGLPSNDRSFTNQQSEGCLPKVDGKFIVSVFTSSPDEMKVSGPQWLTQFTLNPDKFILDLRSSLEDEYAIIVRMHPNQRHDRTGDTAEFIRRVDAVKGVQLIKPRERASTYELIDKSAFVVTFGSTVGLEATYWGKPSILVGRAIWEDCGVSYNCRTIQEVKSVIDQKMPALDKEAAVRVALHLMRSVSSSSSLSYENGRHYVDGISYFLDKQSRGSFGLVNRLADVYLRNGILGAIDRLVDMYLRSGA